MENTSATITLDGNMGADYTIAARVDANGHLVLRVIVHNSESAIAADGVMVYTADPDGWEVTNWLPDPSLTDFITRLEHADIR